jgi:hypothetical protein
MQAEQELVDAILERAREIEGRKKLRCVDAFELARQYGVKVVRIGRICNQYNIRICKCQLGCFA